MPESQIPVCPGPDPAPRPPAFEVPPGACDTHAHLFGPQEKYSYQAARGYTPPDATFAQYQALHGVLGMERGVLVQASVYGTDNAWIEDALRAGGPRLRGVAAVTEDVSDAELARLNDAGVRGLRINLADKGGMPFRTFAEVGKMAERIKEMGWHLEFLIHVDEFPEVRRTFSGLAVDSVFGHLGYVPARKGVGDRGFQDFLGLVREGRCWVKLTAPYRLTAREGPPYADVDPFARALIEAAPDRMLWGSDWPHAVFYKFMPNDGDLLDQLADWAPEEALRRKILVDNPAALYGFAA